MNEEICNDDQLDNDFDENDEQILKNGVIPFSNFYITKGTSSNCSTSQYKLSEHFLNQSVNNVDDCLFEFDVMNIPSHKPRLERSQIYSNVRVSHVNEDLSSLFLMLHENWIIATRMLNDTFQQTLLEKQSTIDISTLKNDGYYMCKSQSSWFRCRLITKISQIVNEENLLTVHLIDWGMKRQVSISDIREIPSNLMRESICCIQCRLSGVNSELFSNLPTLASCHQLLNHHDYEMRVIANNQIVLYHNNENINDQILNLVDQNCLMKKEEYLEDEFRHQTLLNISDEHWAILASYRGDDHQYNDFYILISDKTTTDVDKALSSIDYHQYNFKEPRSIHSLCVKPRMMVIAPWTTHKEKGEEVVGYYRAWIRSIDDDICRIVFVDYGNECDIERSKLFSCPSTVSSLPWLAIRVRLQQYLSHEEFKRFWYRNDSHWIKIQILQVHNTHYTIQTFIDYISVILHEDRKNKGHSKDKLIQSTFEDFKPINHHLHMEEPRLIRNESSSLMLYELGKKLNQINEKIDQNQKRNDQRFEQLLALLQH